MIEENKEPIVENATTTAQEPPVQVVITTPEDAPLTPEQSAKIFNDERTKMERAMHAASTGEPLPEPATTPIVEEKVVATEPAKIEEKTEEKPRNADGTFAKKDDDAKVVAAKTEVNHSVETPPKPTAQPVVLPELPPSLDVKSAIEKIGKEIGDKEYTDADGQKIKGSEVTKVYGGVVGAVNEKLDRLVSDILVPLADENKLLRERLAPLEKFHVEQSVTVAEQSEIAQRDRLVAAGVTDAPTLWSDTRWPDFFKANPQYASMVSSDANRVNDMIFVIDRFRAFSGIEAPKAAAKSEAKPSAPKTLPRSAIASQGLKGSGDNAPAQVTFDLSTEKGRDGFMMAERKRLERQRAEREKDVGM